MTRHLWQHQSTDTSKSWEAFQIYRDMGVNRSLRGVGRQLHKSLTQINKWNDAHDWQSRVQVYDLYQDNKRYDANEAEREHERAERREIVRFQTQLTKKQGGKISAAIDDPREVDPTPAQIRAFLNNAETALEQSRKEYNDLPTKRIDVIDERLLKQTLDAIKQMGQNPADIFNEIIAMAKADGS